MLSLFFLINAQAVEGVAHLRLTDNYWQVWLMDADGNHAQQLTNTPVDKVNVSWGADNQAFLYSTNTGETWLYNFASQQSRQILQDVFTTDASWSPDGISIAYGVNPADSAQGSTTLWVSDLDGSHRTQIASSLTGNISGAQWFSQGKDMVFLQCKLGKDFRVYHEFWRKNQNQSEIVKITADKHLLKFEQAVTPDGRMVYSSAGSGYYEIWRLDSETSTPVQLTHLNTSAGNPSWTSDAKQIFFDAVQNTLGIYKMSSDGNNMKRLTPDNVLAMRPECSK
jgi:dipeptidyl aminopeptidase/acylaminoacyl peptidase